MVIADTALPVGIGVAAGIAGALLELQRGPAPEGSEKRFSPTTACNPYRQSGREIHRL
jgi:hypothetical protein